MRTFLASACLLGLGACGDAGAADTSLPQGRPPAPHAPAGAVGGFAIEVPPITLQPGEERSPCTLFPLVLRGPSRVVSAAVLTTGPGMHHGNITTRKKRGEGVRPCDTSSAPTDAEAFDILEGGTVLFASSTQVAGTEWQGFPAGMGLRIKDDRDGYEIVARMHYLNASDRPVTVAPRYEWFAIAEEALKTEVTPFAWTYTGFQIPPRSDYTVGAGCELRGPMNIVSVLPHMHASGRRLTVGYLGGPRDGALFFDDRGYGTRGETDIRQFDPAVDLSAADGFTFSCTWHNPYDVPLHEGIGKNEMCIVFGYAYPRASAYSAAAKNGNCVAIPPPA